MYLRFRFSFCAKFEPNVNYFLLCLNGASSVYSNIGERACQKYGGGECVLFKAVTYWSNLQLKINVRCHDQLEILLQKGHVLRFAESRVLTSCNTPM